MRRRKLKVAILLLFLIQGTPGQQVERSVLLPSHEAKAVARRYSEARSERITGSWDPTKAELDGLEASLSQIPEMKINGLDSRIHIDNPEQYYRQYVAVFVEGKKRIFVNAICDAELLSDWHHRLVIASGGAKCFWQALYDPATSQFSNLRINARF